VELIRLAKIFLNNAQTVGRAFRPDEFVLAANLISVVNKNVKLAVKTHISHGSFQQVLPTNVSGIWFAWGDEKILDPFRSLILNWYHGLPTQPLARFVTGYGAGQSGVFRVPVLGEKVKHPTGMTNASINSVLWKIL
jgi:hypothetical protein